MTLAAESRRDPAGSAGFLEVVGLSRDFGGVTAVDRVDLVMAPGELRCIIGPNGCGKTTLFNLITGYLPPSAGSVSFRGRPLAGLQPHEVARAGLVRKFQVPSVFETLSVAQGLSCAASVRGGRRRGFERARAIIADLGLGKAMDAPAGSLSHGQKQWLELAMVIATEPSLVLLDEPAAGMTGPEKRRTLELIAMIRREAGVAVLLIEHDMAFVEALGAPVSVMVLGRIVAAGSFAQIRRDPLVREAYLGTKGGLGKAVGLDAARG